MPPRCSEHHQPSQPRDGFFHQSLPRPDHEDVFLHLSSDPSGGLGTSGSWRAPGHQGQAHQGARAKKRAMCRQNRVSPPISHRPGGRKGYEGGSPHNALFSTRLVPPSYPRASTAPTAKLQNSTINVHEIGWRRARQQRRRFSEQRGFQDSHPCFGGPQNPVTGPGETSGVPPVFQHGCHRLPGYRHTSANPCSIPVPDRLSRCASSPQRTICRWPTGDLYGTDRSCHHHHHHIFRPIADLRFRPARAPRNRMAEFSPNARPCCD